MAAAAATPRSGSAPLDVGFSSAGSSDPEGQALSYSWTFGDGQTSTQANPTHTYQQQGSYSARLSVSDGTNTTLSAPITITVGSPPTASILTPSDGATFQAGDVISYSGDGTDPDDGALPASAYSWSVDFLRDSTVEPIQATQGKTGSFTIPTTGRDFSGNTRYRITLTVTDSAGLKDTKSVTVLPQKVNLTFATSPAGGTVHVDGVAKATPAVVDTLVGSQFTIEARDQVIGGTNYTFDTWSDGGAKLHTVTAPASAQTYTATLKAVVSTAPPAFVQARAAESNSGTTTSVAFTNNNTAGNLIVAYVIWNNTGTVALSDSRGNTYASAGARRSWGTSGRLELAGVLRQEHRGRRQHRDGDVLDRAQRRLGNASTSTSTRASTAPTRSTSTTASIGTSRAMSTGPVTTSSASLLFSAGASSHRVTAAGPDFTTRSTAFGNRTHGPDLVRRRHVQRVDDPEPEPVGRSTWWPSGPRPRPGARTDGVAGAGYAPPMLPLQLRPREGAGPLRVLALGAHSDDIEIGCAGTILRLIADGAVASVCWVVLSGKDARAEEARVSAEALLADAPDRQILQPGFRDGFFPYDGAEIKGFFEDQLKPFQPDLILTHQRDDLHQDHRLTCQLSLNTFRDHLILEYEVPKYDGDMGRPNLFVPIDDTIRRRKIDHLMTYFDTQLSRRWFTEDLFSGLLRLRGMECNSPSNFAEAFYSRKTVLL